jgi:hypothetical protein
MRHVSKKYAAVREAILGLESWQLIAEIAALAYRASL